MTRGQSESKLSAIRTDLAVPVRTISARESIVSTLNNIDQIIALYFEADRTWVREKYAAIFGDHTFPCRQAESDTLADEGENQTASSNAVESGLCWRRGQDISEWAESLFNAQLHEVRKGLRPSDEILEGINAQWRLLTLAQKIVAVDSLSQISDEKVPVFQAMASIQRSFGTRACAGLCHAVFPHDAFPISDEMPFCKFTAILDLLGIAIPSVEKATEFEAWSAIGNAVYDFQVAHRLEPWQMWAVVFDLGPRLLPPRPEFPTGTPPKVWVVATHDRLGEFAEIDAHTASDIGDWAINPKARRGDLAVMYCVAPRSSIVSVYRVLSDAYRDPFGGWNGFRAEIGHKIPVPPVSISEMKVDEKLRDWVLVRRNFQGLLHFEVTESAWTRIKELIGTKEPDVRLALDQFASAAQGVREIKIRGENWSEAEVEQQVVIPALKDLGWVLGSNLAAQVPMRIKVGSGRPKGVFADFVGYVGAMTSQAILVIEVKRRISSTKDLEQAAEQAESYAGKLRCSRYAVASPEGFWIYELTFPGQSRPIASFELSRECLTPPIGMLNPLIGFDALRTAAALSRP